MWHGEAVTELASDPIAVEAVPVILDGSGVKIRVMVNAQKAVTVVVGSLLQAAGRVEIARVAGINKIPTIQQSGAAVVENCAPPTGWVSSRAPNSAGHIPAVPGEIPEQVVSLLAIHVDGLAVI